MSATDVNPLPRELAPGVFWLGRCQHAPFQGRVLHGYNSAFLVAGDDSSALIEAGHPVVLPDIERQLDGLLAAGVPELRYLLTTHTETPHSGGLGRLLQHFPEALAYGPLLDLHLVFPQYAARFRQVDPGDSLDLGGRELLIVEAPIRDMPYTRWVFDSRERVLFPGDGFAYAHYHEADHCGKTVEETPDLDLPDMMALFAEIALYWTNFVDMEPYIQRLDALLGDLRVAMVAPTHGLPIMDVGASIATIYDGLRGRRSSEHAPAETAKHESPIR